MTAVRLGSDDRLTNGARVERVEHDRLSAEVANSLRLVG